MEGGLGKPERERRSQTGQGGLRPTVGVEGREKAELDGTRGQGRNVGPGLEVSEELRRSGRAVGRAGVTETEAEGWSEAGARFEGKGKSRGRKLGGREI